MERTYRDDEVREIFGLAARGGGNEPTPVSGADGLTLANLQAIGKEVGLEPAAVAHAAATVEARTVKLPQRTSLGMPIGVGRIVPLPRALTDSEWERLVGELRTTFGARGRVSSQGGLREWVNGNLHACIEPSATGYRLRLGTINGNARSLNALGTVGVAAGAVAFGALVMGSGLQEAVFVPWMISAAGVAALLSNMLRLPRWARRRDLQMASIATTIGTIMDGDPAPGDS
ncbi:MAG: hypothetical protein JWM27_3660 [Gemmatimonadetes bacterium]|nr:hypothetical protein [Gemmatimonadota bacterium]